MIVNNSFLNKIREFGLNSYEAKIWAALLSRGISTAGELSDIANVPRSRSYDVLESLEKKGFIIMKIGKPIKYIAINPSEVLERVKKHVQSESDSKISILDEIKDSKILNELNLLHGEGISLTDPTDFSGALKGRTNIYSQFESLINSAEKSIILMTTKEGLIRKADLLIKHLKKAKDRGVNIKIIAPVDGKPASNAAEKLSEVAKIKAHDKITSRFMIIDGKELVFTMLDDKDVHSSYDHGVWVNTEFFVGAIEKMFTSVWNNIEELPITKTH